MAAKIMFVEAQRKLNIDVNKIKLPKSPVFLAYSIQYKELALQVKKKLGKKVKGFKQVLGCSKLKSQYPILLIGSGKFHAIQLALQGNEVYILEGMKISKLGNKELAKIKAKRKTALMKFLTAEKIGILVSTKRGQENLQAARRLKKRLEKKDKEAFLFVGNNINIGELENYNIDSWVNTACSALTFDSRIVNIDEIKDII